MLQLKFVELHNPLFLGGKNFGLKLDISKLAGLRMEYDRAEKELLVYWNDEVGIVPSSNVACMTADNGVAKPEQFVHPIVAGRQTAQVESPMSHVFAGEGHGKTGRSK